MDELLVQQNSIPDGQTTTLVQESSQHSLFLSRILSHLIDITRPGQPSFGAHPLISGGVDLMVWLPEEL